MKKLLITLLTIPLTTISAQAFADVHLEFDKDFVKQEINDDTPHSFQNNLALLENTTEESENLFNKNPIAQPQISEPFVSEKSLFGGLSQMANHIYNLKIDDTDKVSCLFSEQLTKNIEQGPIEKLHLWSVVQTNFDNMIPENGNNYTKFNVPLTNILLDGDFRGGKESFRLMFDVSHQHNRPFFKQFIQDAYVKTTRVPHHTILFGNSRTGTGYEGEQSPYTLPFINRSQISRNLANVRKVGLRVKGHYDFIDYDLGGYSSDTFFTEFMPGAEIDAWVNFKPLAKLENKGKLTTGYGIVSGSRNSTDYFLSGAYVGYEYKKFWTRMEWAKSDGSNGGSGLTTKHREGWYLTLGYRLTKKLELLARYDDFNLDRTKRKNHQREYSAGLNYYVKGQALKFMLNYVFCQSDIKANSHRILLGAQLAI